MFAIVQNGNIVQLIPDGSPFTLNGVDYPSNWVYLSTPQEKAAIGMVDVVYGTQANQTYYWVTQDAPVYNPVTNQVDINFTATPKDLTSVKTTAIGQVNNTAYTILFPTDWMVVKAFETSTQVPTSWNSWRQSIRTTATNTVNLIEGATDVNGVEQIMSNIAWPKNPDQVALEAAQVAEDVVEPIQGEEDGA